MYIELSHLFWIFLIFLGLAYWWHAYGIKQLALESTKRYCEKMDLQMLDQSIALSGMALRRNAQGRLELERRFRFEFASLGDERYQGLTTMRGRQCTHIQVSAYRI